MYNWAAFVVWSLLALLLAAVASRRWRRLASQLLLAAVAVRVVGSLARHEVLFRFYGGVGDATGYFGTGWRIARQLWTFQAPLLSADFWIERGSWWGTAMVYKFSALVLLLTGPSIRAEFLGFALLALLGLVAFVGVARHEQPSESLVYAGLTWLWPSLWFWPSSVGKEAIIILGLGLATLGYHGRGGRPRWLLLALGMGITFIIRPHVTAVFTVSVLAASWLGTFERFTGRRLLEAAAALLLALLVLYGTGAQFGLAEADLEGVREFVEFRTDKTLEGGSQIGTVQFGPLGVPMAFTNIWLRPFPWEAHNVTAAISALEVMALWAVVLWRRRHLAVALRSWQKSRILRLAVPFLLLYTLMIGFTFANLGIIARQRTPLFPYFFFLLSTPLSLGSPSTAPAVPRRPGRPRSSR